MEQFKAYRADTGAEVHRGDEVTSFRGEKFEFVSARPSRVSGKVTVKHADGWTAEYYPRVVGLKEPIE